MLRLRRRKNLRSYGAMDGAFRDLNRALLSASNDATLMVEDAFLPFRKDGSSIKTRHMNLHQLPWPRDELAGLGELEVELRITLSYFVEPNPGERGWTRRHRYASHNLRFAVKRSRTTSKIFVNASIVRHKTKKMQSQFRAAPMTG